MNAKIHITESLFCQSLFFNKVASLRPEASFIKKETLTEVFSSEF